MTTIASPPFARYDTDAPTSVARDDALDAPPYYPVLLDLRGRRAVVIGGGSIAAQKARSLLDAGARVTVIAPLLGGALAALSVEGAIDVHHRAYRPGDLGGATIAIAATDDRTVNRAVWDEAESERVLLNAVDDVQRCHFIAPSILRRGPITVAVSSSGTCPALAVRLRERIARVVLEEHGRLAAIFGTLRAEVARRVPDLAARTVAWYRVIDHFLDHRAHGRTAHEDADAVRDAALALLRGDDRDDDRHVATGVVHLVGAGPGDPGLITARGLELLRAADVVVHDRLVAPELLAQARVDARLIDVGKRADAPSTPQSRIDAIMIEEARLGRRVVRLKGGDPFVFGRGAEELDALARAGVRAEVVPGVTSAIAAPAAAGIPVTHRELASGFAVVTARQSGDGPGLDWNALARIPTLVVLMGLAALGEVVERLLRAGAPPDTRAAVIASATLPTQRVVAGTLATIEALVRDARLDSPATLVVGDVVRGASCRPPTDGSPTTAPTRIHDHVHRP
jgi:uroporphyrin-III C-methyltransferase/precorrin-2 dehydrogenase/sirohydrochlorin ferrochelatase